MSVKVSLDQLQDGRSEVLGQVVGAAEQREPRTLLRKGEEVLRRRAEAPDRPPHPVAGQEVRS